MFFFNAFNAEQYKNGQVFIFWNKFMTQKEIVIN